MDRRAKFIFENYNFLASQPFKISVVLSVIALAIALIFIGIDLIENASQKIGYFLIIISTPLAILSLVYIAYMRENTKHIDPHFVKEFDYHQSLQMTRFVQKELEMPVDESKYNYSAKIKQQKKLNQIRLLSFVVVFQSEAYIFVRLPKNVITRRGMEDLNQIARDIALELDMRSSSFQPYINNTNLGLGYVSRGRYEVMRLA